MSSDSNTCSSLCHPDEPCAIANDGKCIAWWPDEAWAASWQISEAMGDRRMAWLRYLSHPDGSQERRDAWAEWQDATRRQRAAEAALSAAVSGGCKAARKGNQ